MLLNLEKKWWALIGISICSFIAFMDFTIVNTALPAIQQSLNLSVLELQWVMNSFLLCYCLLLASMGRISDLYGRKRILFIGVIMFTVASMMAAYAQSGWFLIFARGLQGMGEAMIIPAALASVAATFPEAEQGRAIGIWSSIGGLGSVTGPALGGLLISVLSWRSIFWIVLPIAVIGLIICHYHVNESKDEAHAAKIDMSGLLLLTVGLSCLVIPLMQGTEWGWNSLLVWGLLAISIVALIAFYYNEQRVTSPIIQFKLLGNKIFLASSIAQFAFVFFNSAALFLIPLYLQNVRHELPYIIGFMLMPVPLMVVLFSSFAGRIVDRYGAQTPILLGLTFFILSSLMQTQFLPTSSVAWLIIAFIAMGLGWAFTMGPSATAAMSSVPVNFAGIATGALWTIQVIGGIIGLTVGGLIFRHVQLQSDFMTAYHASLWFLTGAMVISLIAVYILMRKK